MRGRCSRSLQKAGQPLLSRYSSTLTPAMHPQGDKPLRLEIGQCVYSIYVYFQPNPSYLRSANPDPRRKLHRQYTPNSNFKDVPCSVVAEDSYAVCGSVPKGVCRDGCHAGKEFD